MNKPEIREKEEIIKDIELLSWEGGFLYSLCAIMINDLLLKPEDAGSIDIQSRLSFKELSFLVGLMVKKPIDHSLLPTEEILGEHMLKTYKLFHELHLAHNIPFIKKMSEEIEARKTDTNENDEDIIRREMNDFFGSGELMVEPIFYSDSGAFDFQYLEFAPMKYKLDAEWIERNKNISIQVAVDIAFRLKNLRLEKLENSEPPEDFSEYCNFMLDLFSFKKNDLSAFSEDHINNFLECFSLIPGKVNFTFDSISMYNQIDSHPIVALSNDLFFLPVIFNLTQSISESPFYWLSKDNKYKDIAFANRGKITEEICYNILVNVFGSKNVYKNVKVLRSKKEFITDIDVLVISGNKAIIVQAKSKKLTELSKSGDENTLKSDFKDAIQKAYKQGLVCRNSILDRTNILTDENGNNLKLGEYINDAYIICVTADHYPAILHQTSTYLKKQIQDPYPLAINIFDLDLLASYLKDPYDLLFYIRQRVSLATYFKAQSEIALLGCHLKHKLYKDSKATMEMVDESLSQLITVDFPIVRGYFPRDPSLPTPHHTWKNDQFKKLIEQVKDTQDPGFTDAIFYLYELAGEGADQIIETMNRMKSKASKDGKQHDFSMGFDNGNSGITFICFPSLDKYSKEIFLNLARARKYKTKADTWLGLASISGSPNIVDGVVFSNDTWKEDKNLEQLSSTMLKQGTAILPAKKRIGRNDPCHCGSGRKFKKCHGS